MENRAVYLILSIIASLFFYKALFELFKYLFNKKTEAVSSTPRGDERYFRYDILTAAVLYLFCTTLFFYPCLRHLNIALIGPPEDNMWQFWKLWWAQKVFTQPGLSPAFTNYIFYPEGASLLYNMDSFYSLSLYVILRQVLNPVIIYNLIILHTFLIAGIGAFLLIRYLTRNSYLGLIGGFIFAFNPSHLAHSLHHIEVSAIQFIPFFILFFIRAVRGNLKKDLFLASLFFLLSSISAWYYLIFCTYFILLSYVYLALRHKGLFLREVFFKSAVVTGSAFLILSPWLFKMVAAGLNSFRVVYSGKGDFTAGYNGVVSDLVALFLPHFYHLSARIKYIADLSRIYTANFWENAVYLGIVNLAIIIFMFKKIISKTAKYFLGLLAFLILSMGTNLHILGWSSPIILPYTIIRYIPFLAVARAPSRLIVFVYLFLSVIVAFALKEFIYSRRPSAGKNLTAAVIALLIFFDYYSVCGPMTRAGLPGYYARVDGEERTFGILNLPVGPRENKTYMMHQTFHGIPIVQGEVCRRLDSSLIDYLETKDLVKQKAQLKEKRVKYIIIHKGFLKLRAPGYTARYEDWSDILTEQIVRHKEIYGLVYEDEECLIFKVY